MRFITIIIAISDWQSPPPPPWKRGIDYISQTPGSIARVSRPFVSLVACHRMMGREIADKKENIIQQDINLVHEMYQIKISKLEN